MAAASLPSASHSTHFFGFVQTLPFFFCIFLQNSAEYVVFSLPVNNLILQDVAALCCSFTPVHHSAHFFGSSPDFAIPFLLIVSKI